METSVRAFLVLSFFSLDKAFLVIRETVWLLLHHLRFWYPVFFIDSISKNGDGDGKMKGSTIKRLTHVKRLTHGSAATGISF